MNNSECSATCTPILTDRVQSIRGIREAVFQSFPWRYTNEGAKYWVDVYQNLEELKPQIHVAKVKDPLKLERGN